MTSMGPAIDGAHNRILALSARASLEEYCLHPVGRSQLQCLESVVVSMAKTVPSFSSSGRKRNSSC